MAIKVIYSKQTAQEHVCDLPKRGFWWNRNPICTPGTIIECTTCMTKYKWVHERGWAVLRDADYDLERIMEGGKSNEVRR